MKRNNFLILPVLVLFLAAVSCGKETAVGGGNLDNNPKEASGEGGGAVDPSEPVAPGTFRAISEGPEDGSAREQTRAYPKWPGGGLSKFDVYWKNNDRVKIYYDRTGESSGVYKASVTGLSKIAPLSIDDGDVDNESGSYWAVSPSSAAVSFSGSTFTLSLPSEQTCKGNGAENCDQTALLMVAKCGPERELYFKQTVSFIRLGFDTDLLEGFYCSKVEIESATNYLTGDFTVSYSGSKPVPSAISANGSKILTLTVRGTSFVRGNYVYAFLPTGTYPSGDLTFTFTITNGSATYYVTKTSAAEAVFARAKYYMIGFTMPSFTDLSESETANCYVVKTPGYYCFNAATRGNGVETDGSQYRGILPEISGGASVAEYYSDGATFIDDDFTADGYLYANDTIYFKTTSSVSAGNSLLSVLDDSDNTLWSWHLWCAPALADVPIVSKFDTRTYTFQNMNLGALQTGFVDSQNGYYYQWGRKDPLDQRVNSTGVLASPFGGDNTSNYGGTLAKTIENPSIYYGYYGNAMDPGSAQPIFHDWWCKGQKKEHATHPGTDISILDGVDTVAFSKTMFDPCPPGYHVPTFRQMWAFNKQTQTTSSGLSTLSDGTHTHYFPMANGREPNINLANYGPGVGESINPGSYFWTTNTCNKNDAGETESRFAPRIWITRTSSGVNASNVWQRAACPVRCKKN